MSSSQARRTAPEIVHIVLSQLGRRYAAHEVSDEEFENKIDRLVREELTPRNLCLLTRDLQDGTTRFIIKDQMDGSVRDLMDCPAADAGRDGHSDDGDVADGRIIEAIFRQSGELV